MRNKKINIGTSGWSYKHWKNVFYPEGMKPSDYLPFYAKEYRATEINTSFYHLPREPTVIQWTEKVPKQFRFCVKMSRFITHVKRLLEPEEALERFFQLFKHMKEKMGPVLIQLPPSLKFEYERAEHFFTVLKKNHKEYDFALEVRHETWMAEESLTLMTKYDIAFVISQSGVKFPYAETMTSRNIYIRFHGHKELYASDYTENYMRLTTPIRC